MKLISEDKKQIEIPEYLLEASGSIIDHNLFNELEENLQKEILYNEIYPEILYDNDGLKLTSIIIFKKEHNEINIEDCKKNIINTIQSNQKLIEEDEIFLSKDSFFLELDKSKEITFLIND